jgi:hypothetical protein
MFFLTNYITYILQNNKYDETNLTALIFGNKFSAY